MLEALVIILALGGLELYLDWKDGKQQDEQTDLLEHIWVELSLMNGRKEDKDESQTT